MSRFLKRWSTRVVRSAATRPLKLPSTAHLNEDEQARKIMKHLSKTSIKQAHLTEVDLAPYSPNEDNEKTLSLDVF